MASSTPRAVTLFCGASLMAAVCPPSDFSTAQNFDLNSCVAGRWYIQEQMPRNYLPALQNYCVYAEYTLGYHLLRYEVTVHNHAEDVGEHPVRQGCRRGLRKVRGRALFPSPVLGWTLLRGGLRRVCGLRVDLGWSSNARDGWRMLHGNWHQQRRQQFDLPVPDEEPG